MSLAGRLVIDRIKGAVSRYIRLPVPPYGQPNYWENSYRTLGPDDINEWGRIGFAQLSKYRYQPVTLSTEQCMAWGIASGTHRSTRSGGVDNSDSSSNPTNNNSNTSDNESEQQNDSYIYTSWGETLQVYPQASVDEPILIIGCGNSQLGEDMIAAQWRGPIIQLDVASRVCDALSMRCAPHLLPHGHMQIVQDDATVLSAIADGKVKAIVDKGLLDALFCADEYNQVSDCFAAAHRVLEPGGCFVTFSFSQPSYFLESFMTTTRQQQRRRRPLEWQSVQVRLLDSIYLYRFQKAWPPSMPRHATKKKGR